MKPSALRKLLSLFLVLILCSVLLQPVLASDEALTVPGSSVEDLAPEPQSEPEAEPEPSAETEPEAAPESDGTAFGIQPILETTADVRLIWTDDSLPDSEMQALVNSIELHPQVTGWAELDQQIEALLAPYAGEDTYTQLWNAYSYLVKNVQYSWEGYSKQHAPAYECFARDYLSALHYRDGLEKSIPDDMANRTYHVLTQKKGVCYDYGIAFAVIARYIGLESYVHTGQFEMEYEYLEDGDHGWAVLALDGANYVFDPQRDARNWRTREILGYYFGIPSDKAWRYSPETDAARNEARDAEMLPVAGDREGVYTITLAKTGDGTVSGGGTYLTGDTITVEATPDSNRVTFQGWYDASGKCLSTEAQYSFPASESLTLTAHFANIYTISTVSSRSGTVTGAGEYVSGTSVTLKATPAEKFLGWYDANESLISSSATLRFSAETDRTVYAMFQGDVFWDISADAWYLSDAMDAATRGIVNGVTDLTFHADGNFTRAMAVTMLARAEAVDLETADLPENSFTDVPRNKWYAAYVDWAAACGVTQGKTETRFAPDDPITRQEFTAMVVRYLESRGIQLTAVSLPFQDSSSIADYAVEPLEKAVAAGLIHGYPTGEFKPAKVLTRAEGVTIIMNMVRFTESAS